jgi:hypothetical protein
LTFRVSVVVLETPDAVPVMVRLYVPAAARHPLVDYADLDLLIASDPFSGVQVKARKLVFPDGAGLGLKPV